MLLAACGGGTPAAAPKAPPPPPIPTGHSDSPPAIAAATMRSGQADDVSETAPAAPITARLPTASLREHNQTDRTFASPSL